MTTYTLRVDDADLSMYVYLSEVKHERNIQIEVFLCFFFDQSDVARRIEIWKYLSFGVQSFSYEVFVV